MRVVDVSTYEYASGTGLGLAVTLIRRDACNDAIEAGVGSWELGAVLERGCEDK
jgi:hypothetical protein